MSERRKSTRRCRLRGSRLVLALLCLAGCGGSVSSGPVPASHLPGYRLVRIGGAIIAASAAEARLLETLEQPLQTTLHFDKTPLDAALQYIADTHGVSIVLDRPKLELETAGSTAPVTATLQGLKLRSALAALLRPLDATYVVRDEVIYITSRDSDKATVARVYYVGDLVDTRKAMRTPDPNALLGWPKPAALLDPGAPDYDTLMDLIKELVAPESWPGTGPSSAMRPIPSSDCLVIEQTEEGHRQICDLLGRLRAMPM